MVNKLFYIQGTHKLIQIQDAEQVILHTGNPWLTRFLSATKITPPNPLIIVNLPPKIYNDEDT